MLDKGFENDIRNIISHTKQGAKRQTMMCRSTFRRDMRFFPLTCRTQSVRHGPRPSDGSRAPSCRTRSGSRSEATISRPTGASSRSYKCSTILERKSGCLHLVCQKKKKEAENGVQVQAVGATARHQEEEDDGWPGARLCAVQKGSSSRGGHAAPTGICRARAARGHGAVGSTGRPTAVQGRLGGIARRDGRRSTGTGHPQRRHGDQLQLSADDRGLHPPDRTHRCVAAAAAATVTAV